MLGAATPRVAVADPAVLASGATFRDCEESCPEMVVIGQGRFVMGSAPGEGEREALAEFERANTAPHHQIVLRYKFALGKFGATRAEFSAFHRETGYEIDGPMLPPCGFGRTSGNVA